MPTDTAVTTTVNIESEQFIAVRGFMITGNSEKSTIEPGEKFLLSKQANRFGVGRRMVDVMDINGNLLGFVTEGQAELIRREDC